MPDKFILHSDYKPTGDQPEAIRKIVEGIREGQHMQTLLGVTGSGKTFTMANVIAEINRPTLVLAHNKTLAAQLCSEFREFFPENAVSILFHITTIISPRRISREKICISKKTHLSTTRSTDCGTRRQAHFLSAETLSSSRACRVYIRSENPKNTRTL